MSLGLFLDKAGKNYIIKISDKSGFSVGKKSKSIIFEEDAYTQKMPLSKLKRHSFILPLLKLTTATKHEESFFKEFEKSIDELEMKIINNKILKSESGVIFKISNIDYIKIFGSNNKKRLIVKIEISGKEHIIVISKESVEKLENIITYGGDIY